MRISLSLTRTSLHGEPSISLLEFWRAVVKLIQQQGCQLLDLLRGAGAPLAVRFCRSAM